MKIPKKVVETVEAKYVHFHAKIRDEGNYSLLSDNFNIIADKDGYVPSFFPYGIEGNESNMGDYIDLFIDLETGQIFNWRKKINPEDVAISFELLERPV